MTRAIRTSRLVVAAGLLCIGCGSSSEGEVPLPSDVRARLSKRIATVVSVTWRTSRPSVGYVEYGRTEALGSVTPIEADDATEHAVTLLGLVADTDYYYRAVTWDGAGGSASEVRRIRTAPLPNDLPQLLLSGSGHDAYTIVPSLGTSPAILIIDAEGRIVWYHFDARPFDFFRARLSHDGNSLLYSASSVAGDPEADTEIVRVALDGSGSSAVKVPLLAHDFVEHADGTLAAITTEYRPFHDGQLRGNGIVEIAPGGAVKTVFSTWDCFDPDEVMGDAIDQGWTFAEALDFDPEEDAYYLSLRNFSSIVKIDRGSGRCGWVLGLYGNTFDFTSGSEPFLHQHQFDLQGRRLLVMDNDGSAGSESRVLEYDLDVPNQRARQTWQYVSDPPVYTFALGEPTRLADGDVFVNWSLAGQLERVTAEGKLRWRINTLPGVAFGFHTLASSLYPAAARRPPVP